ncbi:MAG: AMP-binding protein [Oscillospiraceae bacterium]
MEKTNVSTLSDLVRLAAFEHGDRVFIREKAGEGISEKSYAQFYEDCKKVGGFLKPLGKVHAAMIGATSYNYLAARLGTIIGGNTAVPLDAQLSCDDICDLIIRADVSVFFYDARFAKYVEQIKSECPKIHTYICLQASEDTLSLPKILDESEPYICEDISSDSLAEIVYTSGTTGKSKGVMLSHGNYVDNTFCRDGEATNEDSLLTILPIHHVYCYTCDILLSLRYGDAVCVNDSMLRIPQNLKLFRPTILLLVPMIAATIYKQIKAAAAANPQIPIKAIADGVFGGRLKVIYSGGAYLDPALIKAYADIGIQIAQGYGMTECSPRISSIKLGEGSFGDVGIIVNGCEVKTEDGELLVKSPSVMQGYYKDPEATAEAITPDGWLRTGDLGYVENNRIFITGRKKNLIILSNGENVSPEELENKFVSDDIVAEVMVYAEDSTITAEIVPNPEYAKGMTKEQLVSALKEIIARINKTVSSSKTIRRIRLREVEFEKTTSKKIRRSQSVKGELI